MTAPLPYDPIELVAVDHARNLHRRYRIAATRDLFGHILIEARWGRIGTGGQARVQSFTDAAAAARHVAMLLRRRAGAPRRIGVAYVAADGAGQAGDNYPATAAWTGSTLAGQHKKATAAA